MNMLVDVLGLESNIGHLLYRLLIRADERPQDLLDGFNDTAT